MTDAVTPFLIDIAQSTLDDLDRRLDRARWPEKETVEDWSQGVPIGKIRALCDYWRDRYDWRRCEARLSALGNYRTTIDGLDFHFIHVRSPHADAMPLIMTHGWPGSVIEFVETFAPLTDPTRHGGNASDAFHVVAPSLPGYGFSAKPVEAGWTVHRIAAAWATLMQRLGYSRWVAQGGDWGSAITASIGEQAPDGCAAIHLNVCFAQPSAEQAADLTPQEVAALDAYDYYQKWDSGYAKQQATRPQTLGYGLADSPVGQAAWIYEKMWAWTDNRGDPTDSLSMDTMLDNIMLYWLNNTGASSARLYWESLRHFAQNPIHVPMGVSIFPKEILRASRRWVERTASNLVYWREMEEGGHFAAWEKPDAFVRELRACFALAR